MNKVRFHQTDEHRRALLPDMMTFILLIKVFLKIDQKGKTKKTKQLLLPQDTLKTVSGNEEILLKIVAFNLAALILHNRGDKKSSRRKKKRGCKDKNNCERQAENEGRGRRAGCAVKSDVNLSLYI